MVKIGILGGRLGETNQCEPYRILMDNHHFSNVGCNIASIF